MNPLKFLSSIFLLLLLSVVTLNTTGCTAAQQQEAITVADNLATNIVAYGQTLGNMLQIGLNDIAMAAPTLAKLTSAANSLASSWGMTPVNSQQQATFTSVLNTINKVGAGATTISTFLTGLQTTGTVATTTTPAASVTTPTTLYQGDSKLEFVG